MNDAYIDIELENLEIARISYERSSTEHTFP